MDKKLVRISTIPGLLSADMIRIFLESHGIDCLVSQESAGRAIGLTVDGLGSARVYVPEDMVQEAEALLEAFERGELELSDTQDTRNDTDQNETAGEEA